MGKMNYSVSFVGGLSLIWNMRKMNYSLSHVAQGVTQLYFQETMDGGSSYGSRMSK